MPFWVQSLAISFESILSHVVGGAVGGLVQYVVDRKIIKELKGDIIKNRQSGDEAIAKLIERELEIKRQECYIEELTRNLSGREVDLQAEQSELDNLLVRLQGNEAGLWVTHPKILPFDDFDLRIAKRKPIIITVANLKGGVGKTTLTGNLLAYFDQKLGKRVLGVDLDYQGSLSTMLRVQQSGPVQHRGSYANALLETGDPLSRLLMSKRSLGGSLKQSELCPAFYDFALSEDRLMVEWLLQKGGDDVRYRLAQVLLHKDVAQRYDVILIDVPPRMTTGTINALCASTHVLVPTIFNPLAAEPVENFLRLASGLMNQLNPKLEFLGVVETMSPPDRTGVDTRQEGRRVISEALKGLNPSLGILKTAIPRRMQFAEGVAYLKSGSEGKPAKDAFDALGDEIKGKVGL